MLLWLLFFCAVVQGIVVLVFFLPTAAAAAAAAVIVIYWLLYSAAHLHAAFLFQSVQILMQYQDTQYSHKYILRIYW